jgi:arylsulfatase A-like enzyme
VIETHLRRTALLIGSALFVCCGSSNPEGPSLILVVVDTLREDFLGCYGFEGETSPNLDRLAREGIVFDNCFAQAPWTKPSVATLLTSLHPRTHGVLTHHGWFDKRDGEEPVEAHAAGSDAGGEEAVTDVLPQEALTLAEVLRSRGYRTAAFVANPWIRREWGFAQGFDVFRQFQEQTAQRPILEATQWLEEIGDRPGFVLLHLMDVHGPYDAPEDDFRALGDSQGLSLSRPLDDRALERIPEYLRLAAWAKEPAARDLNTWRTRYAAGVRSVDRAIGALVQNLGADDRLENTVLMVTSDHGEELMEHDGWDHGRNLFDHQTHVPWIVRLPQMRHAGRRVNSVVSLADVMPTALSFLGCSIPATLQGVDRSALDESDDPLAASFAEGIKWQPQVFSVRTGAYKLVADLQQNKHALYHLPTDPGEVRDVSTREPETIRLLLEQLRFHIETTGERGLRPTQVDISEGLQAELNDLGY